MQPRIDADNADSIPGIFRSAFIRVDPQPNLAFVYDYADL
jgi:hypothetical protein